MTKVKIVKKVENYMTSRTEFLYKSIEDSQAVIRALDVKAGFLSVILTMPLLSLGKIYKKCEAIYFQSPKFGFVIIAIFSLSWLFAMIALFRTLKGQSNPAEHVDADGATGCFYGGYLYKFSLRDVFFDSKKKSSNSVDGEFKIIPDDEDMLDKELVFEKVKLAYVRGVKINNINNCIMFSFLWILSGFIIWVLRLANFNF